MARNPFYESMVLDTPEAVANMEKAFEKFEKEGGYKVKNQVVISTDFDRFDRIVRKEQQ